MTASGWFPKRSLHLITFPWIPCALLNALVRVFLAKKSFAEGSSTDPCQLACVSKSVPREVIPSIGCSTQLPRSAVSVTHVSRGWSLSIFFLWSSWSSGFLRVALMMPHQSGVPLKRHLKVLFMGLLKSDKESFLVPLLLIDLLVKNAHRSLDMMRLVSSETHQLWTKKKFWFL